AGSLWSVETLGGWLYRVASRNAFAIRAGAETRREREQKAMDMAATHRKGAEDLWEDWLPLLHEEIGRLPERHRAPIVLCYLHELTYEQAARQLRWSLPTLRSRLARARERLRGRLARRGLGTTGAVALLAIGLDVRPASATVPPGLVRTVVKAATV